MINSTSRAVVGSFGSHIHEVLLRKYLVHTLSYIDDDITPQFAAENFKMKFINRPFPLSKQFEGLNKTFSGTNSALLMAIAWMMISESVLRGILKEKKNNIKHQILVSGGSLPAYWIANYIADIIFHTLAAMMAMLGTIMFNVGSAGIY
jgi:ATP-binding cassette, subfamily A (ABC1), member 3